MYNYKLRNLISVNTQVSFIGWRFQLQCRVTAHPLPLHGSVLVNIKMKYHKPIKAMDIVIHYICEIWQE